MCNLSQGGLQKGLIEGMGIRSYEIINNAVEKSSDDKTIQIFIG